MFVDHQVAFELFWVHIPSQHLIHLGLVLVDPLAAGGNFHAAKEQVEGECEFRVLRVIHGVKRTLFTGIMSDKDEIGTQFLFGITADIVLLDRKSVV